MPDRTLRVEAGERIVLSPESKRFKANFRQVRPRSASAVRDLIGVSEDMAKSLSDRGLRSQDSADNSAIVAVEELESADEVVRHRAMHTTEQALHGYVRSGDDVSWGPMEAVIGAYLEQTNLVLHVATLQDIEVLDGGVLTVPAGTHLVEANNITIYGTGRIDCTGHTRFDVASIIAR
jgi:hypothetical protein